MNYKAFSKRVVDYAKATGIGLTDSGRDLHLKPLGLPDPRGFTPHLRKVLLDSKTFHQFRSEKADFSGERKWIIHDLLHIMFYDFAFFNLGEEAFRDPVRFFEVHLASEAFAVLTLDYHVLSQNPGEGLAVEFNKSDWPSFQKMCPDLPHYLSTHFISVLTDLYLTGNSSRFEARKPSPEFNTWIGHEIRYGDKQRLYVAQWRADLDNNEFDGEIPSVENSFVSEAVRDLLTLVLGEKSAWEEYVDGIKSSVSSDTNYFEDLKKYKTLKKSDYRFTDFRSQEKKIWKENLESVQAPNASQLFLFWQIASSIQEWSEDQMRLFGELHKSSNTKKTNEDLWKMTQEVLIKNLERLKDLPPSGELRACFFLP